MYLSIQWIFLKQCNPFWQHITQHMGALCSPVYAAVWWRSPATNISHLYQRLGNLTVFQAALQGLPAVHRAEPVWFMNNMSLYLISYRTALPSHSTSPRCPLPHSQKKPLHPSFSESTEVTCCVHYCCFWGRWSNYVVRATHCVNRVQCYYSVCTVESGWVSWLVLRLWWLPSTSFLRGSWRKWGLVLWRVDVLLWSKAGELSESVMDGMLLSTAH